MAAPGPSTRDGVMNPSADTFPMSDEERVGVNAIRKLCSADMAGISRQYAYIVGEVCGTVFLFSC